MAKLWRQVLERLELQHQKRMEWEETHPPITRLSVDAADAQRTIQPVGEKAVTCNLPCYGNDIPERYSRVRDMINVFDRRIIVPGYYDSKTGEAFYLGLTCKLADGKVCVASDEILRKSVERRSVER